MMPSTLTTLQLVVRNDGDLIDAMNAFLARSRKYLVSGLGATPMFNGSLTGEEALD